MAESVTFQALLTYLTLISVPVGVFYHIMTLRNTRKNQELTMKAQEQSAETRKIQLILDINRHILETPAEHFQEIMSLEWDDFNDFVEKYGIANNPENYNKRISIWRGHHVSGLMIRDGLLDVETYIEYLGDPPIQVWGKYRDIVEEFRRQFELPNYLAGMEILAEELNKYRIEKGWGPKGPYLYANANPELKT